MHDRYLLIYVFTTFVVGIACFGVVVVLARRRGDEVARAYLLFYATLSVLVGGALLLAFAETTPGLAPSTRFGLEYLESFVGRYGLMFSLPFFAHRLFGVRDRARDRLLLGIVVAAALAQHLTEFVLPKFWDDLGDVAEDALFAVVVAYTLWIGATRWPGSAACRPLAARFLVLLLLALPGIAHDLFLSDGTRWRFYPLWYCLASVVLTSTLVGRRLPSATGSIPASWGLTGREQEVARLIQRGLSNKEIARELGVSSNTVKTHLRAVFDKSGIRSRLGLMAVLGAEGEVPGGGGIVPSA